MNRIMYRMKIILLSCSLLASLSASATRYYVSSSTGKDKFSRDGKSEASAWETFSEVNRKTFSPGDSILFKKGDIWRETLKVPSSGKSGSFITFSTYSSGANPIIYGSKVSTGWKNYRGNIWVSSSKFTNPRTSFSCEIFFVEHDNSVTWGLFKANTGSLAADHDWTWSGNFIYVYSVTDPGTRYSDIEVPQSQMCIDLNNKEYLDINGIDLFYGIYEGITYNWSHTQLNLKGLIIENCRIAFIGGNITSYDNENGFGIDVAYSDMIVRNCEIHHCGRRGISFHLYGSGFTVKNVLIEQNYFHDGYHTTGVDISVGSGSFTGSFDGIIIRRNLFSDPPTSPATSEHIFIQNYNHKSGVTDVNNIYIYSNIFKYPSHSAIMAEGCQGIYIYNNTFYNHNTTKSANVMHVWIDANNTSVKIKNNIFYTELSNDNNGNGLELFSQTDYKNVDADFNLYYRTSSSLRIINFNKTGYSSSQIATVRSTYGWESHSPTPANPLFAKAADNDFTPTSGSPAIGAGINLNLPVDYKGNKFDSITPSIGAFEGKQNKVTRAKSHLKK